MTGKCRVMTIMTWKEFYEKYDDWAESTVISKISSLKDIGPSSEVVDCANYIPEKAAEKLVRKAMSLGTVFTPNDITELDSAISENLASSQTWTCVADIQSI